MRMTGGTLLLLVIGALVLYSIFQVGGVDAWKQHYISNTLDTSKDVTQSIIDTFDKDETTVTQPETTTAPSDAEYVGKPVKEVDCVSDGDCIAYVDDCDDCQCDLATGECYR